MAWIRWRGRTGRQWAYVGYIDPRDGREKYFATKSDDPAAAERERERIERSIEGREPKPAPRAPAADVVADWIKDLRRRGRSEGTLSGYETKMGRILRAIGDRPLHAWTRRMLEDVLLRQVRPGTVRGEFTVLGTFLTWCERERRPVPRGLLEDLRRTEKPTVRLTERDVLAPEDVKALLQAARGKWIEPAIALAALAGLGIGDIRSLTWSEVRGLGTARPELQRKQGRQKTGERLWVPLAPEAAEVLLRHQHSGPRVCRLKATRATLDALDRATQAAGVPRGKGDGWHRLRHTFGTRLSALGYDVETIRALLGHARASTVTLRYLHPVTDRMREAVGRVAG